jgi:hypothetical protein
MELILQNSLCSMAFVGFRTLAVILHIICVCFIRQCRLLYMVGQVKGTAVGPEDRYVNCVVERLRLIKGLPVIFYGRFIE